MSTTKKVIDVSEFQGAIHWKKVAASVDAAIIRAGYRGYGSAGTLQTDSMFKANMESATDAGIPVGVYWISQATSEAEALQEATHLNSLLSGCNLSYPVYLDSEYADTKSHKGRADVISTDRRTIYGLAFCKAMKNYGYTPGLYCSENWFTAEIDGSAFAEAGYSIWIAKYSSIAPFVPCDAWQYTRTGRIPGIAGDVDISEFYKDYAGLADYNAVQARFGLSPNTMGYLLAYQYSADLLRKLAENGHPIQEADYRAYVQTRFGLSTETMDYLDGWTWGQDLLRKLATAE